jgi:hypothetical protein
MTESYLENEERITKEALSPYKSNIKIDDNTTRWTGKYGEVKVRTPDLLGAFGYDRLSNGSSPSFYAARIMSVKPESPSPLKRPEKLAYIV